MPRPESLVALRNGVLALVLAAGAVILATVVGRFYPIRDWLFWVYLQSCILCALWSAACVAGGDFVVRRVLGRALPFAEHVTLSFAVGVYVFFAVVFAGGILSLYGAPFFFAAPLVLIAAGGRGALGYFRRWSRHVAAARRRAVPGPRWAAPIVLYGACIVALTYVVVLSPENVGFDGRWYHLPLAEHYAAAGSVRAFPEGWYPGTSPHLASFLYAWAFQLPWGGVFERVVLCTHLHFTALVWTTASIPPLVRAVLHGRRVRLAWAARLLFPGLYIYDTSLGEADVISAIWTAPLFTLFLRAIRGASAGPHALLGVLAAGSLLTKYSGGLPTVAFASIAVAAAAAWRSVRARGGARLVALRGAAVFGLATIAATAPHWLKNWVFYGNPMYPAMHALFEGRPWTVDSAALFDHGFKKDMWHPSRDLAGLGETIVALFTFSFRPHDWLFEKSIPFFGSLFTLLLGCILFFRRTGRLWMLVGAAHAGLFVWYSVHHQDRYLVTLSPWFAAASAATLALIWAGTSPAHARGLSTPAVRASAWTARVMLVGLVALQLVWGSGAYVTADGAAARAVKRSLDLVASGHFGKVAVRARPFAEFSDVAAVLPKGANVLVHDMHPHLGLEARSVSDWPTWQGGISYGRAPSPANVWDGLRALGVTHLLWTQESKAYDSFAGDIAFFHFARRHGVRPKKFGAMTLAEMPASRPPDEDLPGAAALVLSCGGAYPDGLFRVGALTVPVFGPKRKRFPAPERPSSGAEEALALARTAEFVVVDPRCHAAVRGKLGAEFDVMARRKNGVELLGRR